MDIFHLDKQSILSCGGVGIETTCDATAKYMCIGKGCQECRGSNVPIPPPDDQYLLSIMNDIDETAGHAACGWKTSSLSGAYCQCCMDIIIPPRHPYHSNSL